MVTGTFLCALEKTGAGRPWGLQSDFTVPLQQGLKMLTGFCPRLSEAKTLLPVLRAQLAVAAARHTLPSNVSLELLPIVEDGLFGYELVPDRQTHTYLMIGYRQTGQAVVRRTLFCEHAPSALRLAALDGKPVAGDRVVNRQLAQQRDSDFADIFTAIDSALAQLVTLFPGRPRKPIEVQVDVHRYLDEALVIAHTYLRDLNPHIRFCGLPQEAQYGFALIGDHGEHGELVSRRPDMWVLRWKSSAADIYEEWAIALPPISKAPGATASGQPP